MKTPFYDLLVRLFWPAGFRARHGGAMEQAYRDALAAVGARTGARWRVRLTWWLDAVRHGLAERAVARHAVQPERRASAPQLQALPAERRPRTTPWPGGLVFDLRLALRRLVREPGFTTFVALTLALGIGGTASVFAFYNAAFLRPLPWPAGERLVRLEMVDAQGRSRARLSLPDVRDLASAPGVAAVGAVDYGAVAVAGGQGDPEVIRSAYATPSLFDVLQVGAARGRLFASEEGEPGRGDVAVLSDGLWRRRFGADPGVMGSTIDVQGRAHVIIGVLPATFAAPDAALEGAPELWLPLAIDGELAERGSRWLQGLARMEEHAAMANVAVGLDAAAARLAAAHPQTNEGLTVRPVPLREAMWGDVRTPMRLVMAAAAFVLLIACANLANLLLARGANRANEMALRAALGAGRARTVQQVILEHGALALLGGIAGAGLVVAVRALSLRVAAGRLPLLMASPIDPRVIGFLAVLSLLAAVLFGALPALRLRGAGARLLREGRGATRGRAARIAQRTLVGAQVALSFVLLAGAALLLRGFDAALAIDPGFDARRVLAWEVSLPAARYAEPASVVAFHQAVLGRLAAVPGVESAALVDRPPLGSRYGCAGLAVEGEPPPTDPSSAPCSDLRGVSSDYLRAMGIRLLDGSPLDATRPAAVLVNRTLAESLWPGESPLGRRLALADVRSAGGEWWEVVGLVDDVLHLGPQEPPLPEIYLPFESAPDRRVTFVVRTAGDPAALGPAVRRVIAEVDATIPLRGLRPLHAALLDRLSGPRTGLYAVGMLAAVALFLAVVGLYGVQSWLVARRSAEIGIRMALGANRKSVQRLVLGDGMKVVVPATLIGGLLALGVARAVRSFLFGANPADPLTFAAVALLLLTVSALACWAPARRAASIGPTAAMRVD